jgi:hypothetical protein
LPCQKNDLPHYPQPSILGIPHIFNPPFRTHNFSAVDCLADWWDKMGICPSHLTPEQNQELGNSKLIDRQMREAAERESAKIKLLLLGTGESGKSTLFKQMRILYGNGFSPDDLVRYKWHIWANIIECMRSVCDAVEIFGYGKLITDPKVLEAFKRIKSIQRDSALELTEEIREKILFLWNDPVIIRTIARRNEFQVCWISSFPSFPFNCVLPLLIPPAFYFHIFCLSSSLDCSLLSRD